MFRDPFEGQDNEPSLIHFGVKGMKWGVRKGQVSSFMRKGTPEAVMGKQIVAGLIVSYGAVKIASFASRKTKHAANKLLNKIDPPDPQGDGKLRETGRYYDKKAKDYVYRYD